MAKANQKYFVKRGEQDVVIEFEGEDLDITILKPTNKQHDEMMEKYSEVSPEGIGNIHMADFVEEQMINNIVTLPFKVPRDENMEEFIEWEKASPEERKIAVSTMDSRLRDSITTVINGATNINDDELGN